MSSGNDFQLIIILRPSLSDDTVNRHVGDRAFTRIESLLLDTGITFQIWCPSTLSEARDMARSASVIARVVVAAGGDGTINAVAGGLTGTECCLGILPVGSGNDIARGLHIPLKLQDAVNLLANGYRMLHPGLRDSESGQAASGNISIRKLDAGIVTGMDVVAPAQEARGACPIFINTLGFGFDGKVAWNASRIRIFRGKWKYLSGVLKSLFTYRACEMEITADHKNWRGRYLMATVANGPYEGGGIRIAPNADSGDGFFDLVLIRDTGVFARIPLLLRVLLFGAEEGPKITSILCRSVSISSALPVTIHADGEVLSRQATAITAVIHPAELTVICGTGGNSGWNTGGNTGRNSGGGAAIG